MRDHEHEKGARLTGDTRAEVAADLRKQYEAGASIRDLTRSTGRSYGSVSRLLADAGTVLRPRGGNHQSGDDRD